MATSISAKRRAITQAAVTLMIAWTCLFGSMAWAAPGLDASLNTRHFAVRYDSSHQFQAKLLADIGEEELSRVARDLDYTPEPNRPFPLRIYNSRDAFKANEGFAGNTWTVGAARSTDESIAIDATGLLVLPREVLSHEITHAVIFRILGPSLRDLPLWFNEGLAQYESQGSQANNDTIVANTAADGSLPNLGSLSEVFPVNKTDQAYAVSSSAIRYMVKKWGPASPKLVIQELARTGSFDKAMLKVTGLTGDQFADKWYDRTTARYWVVKVTRLITGIVSAFMAALAIAAFIARRRRMAQAARQWEEEEFQEALRRQQGNDWSI